MSEFLDLAKDFCADNYIWIIGALIVLMLILIAVGVGKRKNKSDSPASKEYFLEGEYDAMLKSAAMNEKKETGAAEIRPTDVPKEVSTESETAAIPEIIQAELDALVEASEKEELSIDDDDKHEEELQPVQININIQRGQVKIDYDEDGKVRCTVEADPEEDNFKDSICAVDTVDIDDTAGIVDIADTDGMMPDMTEIENIDDAADTAETAEPKGNDEAANTYDFIKDKGIILEKIELVKAAPVKKYGRNNFNTSRSGRIFTEEELRKQIKK